MSLHWTVVATPQRKENYAKLNLERQGFAVYCPTICPRIKHARSTTEVLRPMFPGYLFVQVSQDVHCWRPILSTKGVRALIRSGNRPVSADELVLELQASELGGAVTRTSTAELGPAGKVAEMIKTLPDEECRSALLDALAPAGS